MSSWVVEAGSRTFAGERPSAAELAASMLDGKPFAWLSDRQMSYLRSLIMGEHFKETGSRVDVQARAFSVRPAGLDDYRLITFFAPPRGLLAPVEADPRPIAVAERVELHRELVAATNAIRGCGEGAFEAQRELIATFRARYDDHMGRVRALPFYDGANCADPNGVAELPYYLVIHQTLLFMESLYHAERLTEKGFRVYRHGGTKRDTWKPICVTTFEPKARDMYRNACSSGTRGGVRLIQPDGHVNDTFFEMGAETARQCAEVTY